MLPIFLEEFFSGLRFSNFGFAKKGNAAHFSGRTFSRYLTLQFGVHAKGKCCPFFWKNFFLVCDFPILGSQKGEMLPIFLEELFLDIWLCNFGFMLRENSAHFSGRIFFWFATLQFWVRTKEKCCPFFWKNLFLIFDFAIWGLCYGEILPIFLEELFWLATLQFLGSQKGEMLPIFLEEHFLIFDFAILGLC